MKKRTHQFVINVTFDKPCTKAHALLQARNDGGIDAGSFFGKPGVHYCDGLEDGDPETFKVRSIRPIRARSR